ncbi:hypothetical protein BC833DRAFT_617514 [Globomyces pollinis-pini]|nr:hypothetical protein BC833DRAFT_617514 [Globomyces pollinis-pini]
MNNQKFARKTAYRHYVSYMKNPIPGVTMHQVNADCFHVNTELLEGPYQGILVHWELTINENYPFEPPFGKMADGYNFGHRYHHHLYETQGICADFLGNFSYMNQSAGAGYGWTSGCDFHGLMINMQPFLADPDGAIGPVRELLAMDKKYSCDTCGHSTAKPYPPIPKIVADLADQEEKNVNPAVERARREMFCAVTKENIIDNKSLCLGYPIDVTRDRFGRIHSKLIPELISYDAYMSEYQVAHSRGITHLRTTTGQPYSNWLPMFVEDHRFLKNREILLTTISVIAKGEAGTTANDFNSGMILKVLLALMNQQVVAIMQGNMHESESAIIAYANVLRLLKRLIVVYPHIQKDIDRSCMRFLKSPESRTKRYTPDIGEFLIKLALSSDSMDPNPNHSTLTYNNPSLRRVLLKEYFARQIRWVDDKVALQYLQRTEIVENKIKRLKKVFDCTLTSNRLLLFNLEMIRYFVTPNFNSLIDSNYGLLPPRMILSFQHRIKLIKHRLHNYSTLVKAVGISKEITSANEMIDFINGAVHLSKNQGYHRV